MEIRLCGGACLSGTAEQVSEVLKALEKTEDGVHYFSDTYGMLRITEMETTHLRAVALKRYRTWIAALAHPEISNKSVVTKLRDGVRTNVTLSAILDELVTR